MTATLITPPKPLDRPLPAPPKFLPPPVGRLVVPDIDTQTPRPTALTNLTPQEEAPAEQPQVAPRPVVPARTAPVIDAARSCAKPGYPARAIRADWEGVVDLEFLIGLDGRVVDSRIAKSSGHDLLDNAARDALSLCRFTPGTADGKPEQSWAHLRYKWRLDQ